MLSEMKKKALIKRLLECKQNRDTLCVDWIFAYDAKGMPIYKSLGVWQYVHKLVFELDRKTDVMNLGIIRTCGNKRCINVDHLEFTGEDDPTPLGLERTKPKGELHKNATLTETQVLEIIERYGDGTITTFSKLAKEYGVAKSTIQNVLQKKTWRHLHDPQTDDQT